jgi:hypothetical protein
LNTILKPLIALSAAGFVASLIVHLCALAGVPNPFGHAAWALHIGIFVVWLPAIIVTNMRIGKFAYKRNDFWKVALAGAPKWMQTMVKGFFIYAVINFAFFIFRAVGKPQASIGRSFELQGFSGHWMAFYSAGIALLYSATKRVESKCANGHQASPVAKFCDQCGTPVTTQTN